MQGMLSAMQHLAAEKRSARMDANLPRSIRSRLQDQPEAVLAAMFSQLHRRDTVVTQSPNPLAQTALDAWFAHTGAPVLHELQTSAEECAAIAAGMALRIKDRTAPSGDTDAGYRARPVVVALLNGSPMLASVLQLIQQHDFSLVLVVHDEEPESRAEAQRRQRATTVPIMLVDRADAVAVCRVAQECLLRARNGWGGAVIHAARLSSPEDALRLMQEHMKKRGLPLTADIDTSGHR